MKRMLVMVLLFGLLGFYSHQTKAENIGYGARAIGMGGAYTAIADDASSTYWNPAGITRVRLLSVSPGVGLVGNNWEESQDLLDLDSFPPQFPTFEADFMGFLGVTTKHIAINVLTDLYANAETPSATVGSGSARLDGYGAITVGWKFGEKWAVGVNLKAVHSELSEYQLDLLGAVEDNYIANASADGQAFDLGVQYQLHERIRFGFTARNVYYNLEWEGEKQLYNADGTPSGSKVAYDITAGLPQSYVLGIGLRPFQDTLIAVDINQYEEDQSDFTRIHFGLEHMMFFNTLALRLGTYTNDDASDTWTGGIGLKLGPVMVDAAAVIDDVNNGYYLSAGFKF